MLIIIVIKPILPCYLCNHRVYRCYHSQVRKLSGNKVRFLGLERYYVGKKDALYAKLLTHTINKMTQFTNGNQIYGNRLYYIQRHYFLPDRIYKINWIFLWVNYPVNPV